MLGIYRSKVTVFIVSIQGSHWDGLEFLAMNTYTYNYFYLGICVEINVNLKNVIFYGKRGSNTIHHP